MLWSLIFLTAPIAASAATKIPESLHLERCKFDDPNIDECLRKAMSDSLQKLKNGESKIGIPKFEPLEIIQMSVKPGAGGPFHLDFDLKDIKIFGIADNLKLTKLRLDKNNRILQLNGSANQFLMKGTYKSSGKLLAIPLEGDGPFEVEANDLHLLIAFHFEEVQRKGLKFWELSKLDFKLTDVGLTKYHFGNMIKGNKALDETVNQSINENWRDLNRQVVPAFSEGLRQFFFAASQRFFKKVPFNEIFL